MKIKRIIAEQFYRKFLPEIKEIQKKDQKKLWKELCEYVTTINGHAYYRFEDSGKLPIARFEQLQAKVIELSKQLTIDEQSLLIDIAETSLETAYSAINTKAKASGIQTAIFAIQEMKTRNKTLMFHPQILVELCALSLIRDDESPYIIDKQIHQEKIKDFNSEMPSEDFFLHLSLIDVLPNYAQLRGKLSELWNIHLHQIQKSTEAYREIRLAAQ